MSTIKEQILKSHVYERYTTENGNKRLGILEDELDAILDEVAKEFHDLVDKGYPDRWEIRSLVKKWFGESPAVISQIGGGCLGHIDLEKLQDLEKEP